MHFVESIPRLAKVLEEKGQFSEPKYINQQLRTIKTLVERRTIFLEDDIEEKAAYTKETNSTNI